MFGNVNMNQLIAYKQLISAHSSMGTEEEIAINLIKAVDFLHT